MIAAMDEDAASPPKKFRLQLRNVPWIEPEKKCLQEKESPFRKP